MRKATFALAETFHHALVAAYESERYDLVEIPPGSVEERTAFVEAAIERP